MTTTPEIAAARLAKRSTPEPNTGCVLWWGATSSDGYGNLTVDGKIVLAHRLAFELSGKSIPEGLVIDHLCNQRCCVNPLHMVATTQRQNNARTNSPTATHARKTHCKRGHEFTPENTFRSGNRLGYGRGCRACRSLRVTGIRSSQYQNTPRRETRHGESTSGSR